MERTMNRDQLKRLIQGPIATIPSAFDGNFQLDTAVMADLTEWWIERGLRTGTSVLKVAAAMGEGPDLNDDEWPRLLRAVVDAARGRVPVVCGLKTKNTLHTIDDARRAADLGATGLQIDLPIFHHPTQDDYVRYFGDISAAIDIGIIIYNTWWFGAESIAPETLIRLSDAEHVVGVKWATPPETDYDAMRQFAHIFNVIDNSGDPVRSHRMGARGYISSIIPAWPEHDLQVWALLEERHYDEAQALYDRINGALRRFEDELARESGGYRLPKALMEVIERPVGPPRPPTLPLSTEQLHRLHGLMAGLDWPGVTPLVAA
jgi:4-hydroxy-tetrahydrodipicolinate synthase